MLQDPTEFLSPRGERGDTRLEHMTLTARPHRVRAGEEKGKWINKFDCGGGLIQPFMSIIWVLVCLLKHFNWKFYQP